MPTALTRDLDVGGVGTRLVGETHVLLGNQQQAYEYAYQALDLTRQTQSLDILRHVGKLRDDLTAASLLGS